MSMVRVSSIRRPVIITGAILLAMGSVFLLQSHGMVGPESSFMYTNPEWDANGKMIILVGGGLCLAAGVFMRGSRSQR